MTIILVSTPLLDEDTQSPSRKPFDRGLDMLIEQLPITVALLRFIRKLVTSNLLGSWDTLSRLLAVRVDTLRHSLSNIIRRQNAC